jgi:hypothetical protein
LTQKENRMTIDNASVDAGLVGGTVADVRSRTDAVGIAFVEGKISGTRTTMQELTKLQKLFRHAVSNAHSRIDCYSFLIALPNVSDQPTIDHRFRQSQTGRGLGLGLYLNHRHPNVKDDADP